MMIFKKFLVVFLLIFTTSCVETVVVASLATGVVVTRTKSLEDTRQDVVIATKLGADFVGNGLKNPNSSVDITVNEGRVLLTGILTDPQKAKLASELAWKIPHVKEVIDEIQIHEEEKFKIKDVTTSFSDYAITTEVEAKLLLERKINSSNYKITTVGKTVYLLGVAEDSDEMQKVLSIISKIRGVEKVVNHVILADDNRRNG
jgi:osmotically-inducible protein OsmY